MYMSPERLNNQGYSYNSDIWSMGLTLITLARGQYPFSTSDGFWGIYQAVRAEPPGLSTEQYSKELCDFVALVRPTSSRTRVTLIRRCSVLSL